jgi:hypothetical protein
MQMILMILCALMILFAGGCALAALGAGAWPLVAIPSAIVAANVLVILAVLGKRAPSFGAFASLAVIDLVIGLPMLAVMLTNARMTFEDEFQVGVLLLAIAVVLKGIMTIAAASRLRRQSAAAVVDRDPEAENPVGW